MGFLNKNFGLKTLVFGLLVSNAFFWQRLRAAPGDLPGTNGPVQVFYSLQSHPNDQIIDLVRGSNAYVDFAVYTLTRSDITDALIAAKLRGIAVRGILDFSQSSLASEKPQIAKLKKYGIPLEIPQKQDQSLMHAKFVVTDSGYASGSYNWTTSATSYNDEVLEVGAAGPVSAQYRGIFETLWKKYAK